MSRRALKAVLAASAALALAAAVASCSSDSASPGGHNSLDLKIGALVPISGVEEPFGPTGQKSTDLAVKEIREAIEETKSDHTVAISHQNYRSEPNTAQELAARMARSGTTCFVGPWSTQALIPVGQEVSAKRRVLTISPGAGNDALATLSVGGYVNRTIPPASLQGDALATLMAKELGGARNKTVSIAAIQNIYGRDLARSFSAAWRKAGGKVGAEVIYQQNLPDYKKQAEELVAPNPDAFVFFDFQESYTRVATDLIKTKKWKATKSFAADSLAVSTLGQAGGVTIEGLRGVAPSWPRIGASARAFEQLWLQGPPPRYRQPYDTQAFDATVLCYLAAVAAGSTRGSQMRQWLRKVSSPPGEKFDWQRLPEAIKALEAGEEIDYQGASGPIDIEPLDITQPANPTAGFYDAYRYENARLGVYGTVSVPPSRQGLVRFPIKYVTPRVPGVGPEPGLGPTGPTGAAGANGAADGKGARQRNAKKDRKKKGN